MNLSMTLFFLFLVVKKLKTNRPRVQYYSLHAVDYNEVTICSYKREYPKKQAYDQNDNTNLDCIFIENEQSEFLQTNKKLPILNKDCLCLP